MVTRRSLSDLAKHLNQTQSGENGIGIMRINLRPTYFGKFLTAFMDGHNLVLRFTEQIVVFYDSERLLISVEEKTDEGYPLKELLDEMYIGCHTFMELTEIEDEDTTETDSIPPRRY